MPLERRSGGGLDAGRLAAALVLPVRTLPRGRGSVPPFRRGGTAPAPAGGGVGSKGRRRAAAARPGGQDGRRGQAWLGIAKNHEAAAAGLRATLDQLLPAPLPPRARAMPRMHTWGEAERGEGGSRAELRAPAPSRSRLSLSLSALRQVGDDESSSGRARRAARVAWRARWAAPRRALEAVRYGNEFAAHPCRPHPPSSPSTGATQSRPPLLATGRSDLAMRTATRHPAPPSTFAFGRGAGGWRRRRRRALRC